VFEIDIDGLLFVGDVESDAISAIGFVLRQAGATSILSWTVSDVSNYWMVCMVIKYQKGILIILACIYLR